MMDNTNGIQNGQIRPSKPSVVIAFIWIVAFISFNIVQLICAIAWGEPGFDLRMSTIGALGETQNPCSEIMNYAFMFQGAVIVIGIWVMKPLWRKSIFTTPARVLLSLYGLAFIILGFFPQNIAPSTHYLLGIIPSMLFGATGLVVAGIAMNHDRFTVLWIVTALLGIIALLFGFLYYIEINFGLGIGLMERTWMYMPLIWSLLIAISTLRADSQPVKKKT